MEHTHFIKKYENLNINELRKLVFFYTIKNSQNAYLEKIDDNFYVFWKNLVFDFDCFCALSIMALNIVSIYQPIIVNKKNNLIKKSINEIIFDTGFHTFYITNIFEHIHRTSLAKDISIIISELMYFWDKLEIQYKYIEKEKTYHNLLHYILDKIFIEEYSKNKNANRFKPSIFNMVTTSYDEKQKFASHLKNILLEFKRQREILIKENSRQSD